jgi:hypothetical protein
MTAADYLTYLLRFTRPAEMVPFYPHDSEIEKYARTIGLDNVPPEFRAHLVSEIDLCLLASGFDRKRPSEVKQQLLRLSRSAVRASKDLRRLVERLTDLANAKLPSLLKLHQDLTGDVRPTIIVDRMKLPISSLDLQRSHKSTQAAFTTRVDVEDISFSRRWFFG